MRRKSNQNSSSYCCKWITQSRNCLRRLKHEGPLLELPENRRNAAVRQPTLQPTSENTTWTRCNNTVNREWGLWHSRPAALKTTREDRTSMLARRKTQKTTGEDKVPTLNLLDANAASVLPFCSFVVDVGDLIDGSWVWWLTDGKRSKWGREKETAENEREGCEGEKITKGRPFSFSFSFP